LEALKMSRIRFSLASLLAPPPENFQAIGHSALAVLIGLAGGMAGYFVQGRTRSSDSLAQGAQP
jgi:hypothetical protein